MAGFQTHISFHGGIRNKKVCKVKNFQVWVTHDNFEQKAKRRGGGGGVQRFKGLVKLKKGTVHIQVKKCYMSKIRIIH